MGTYDTHKLLVANRGEIAVRIIQTAKRLGLRTVAIYTPSDSLSPHVLQADEASALEIHGTASEAVAYLSIPAIIAICKAHSVTLVHPGYGFLSENAEFSFHVIENGMVWLGPQPDLIGMMGIKHEAKKVALGVGLEVVPGSDGLVSSEEEALEVARRCGFPVMLKATAGGGGMGMFVCYDEESLKKNFYDAKDRAQALFQNDGVFLEKYISAAHHVEIQIFGNGLGDVVHMRERECSIQRKHQKLIEESPSPFCQSHPGLVERMCEVAVKLGKSINYRSAGTIEFLVDDETAKFYFLEMNTRIQVEHPVTEQTHPGLDIVELMIKQGVAGLSNNKGLLRTSPEMTQSEYDEMYRAKRTGGQVHSIEGRIYAENPYEGFIPSPGLLQYVSLDKSDMDWLRIDSWVETGMTVTPHFDPLLAKIIVTGSSREEAVNRFSEALNRLRILGPITNTQYLAAIAENEKFRAGSTTTNFLETFSVTPRVFKVLSSGVDTAIQDLPGRTLKLGIPMSGPMDDAAFSAGNILAGNPHTAEGLEVIIIPGRKASFQFFVTTVISVTGKEVTIRINGKAVSMWTKLIVPQDGIVDLETLVDNDFEELEGFRAYLCIRGGFPDVPVYLRSKSTSMGLGGYQGRSLIKGDLITLGNCAPAADERLLPQLPQGLWIRYPLHWVIYVLPGPHGDDEFMTEQSVNKFYSTFWKVSSSSNRLGIRLEPDTPADKIKWARESGGEGGSHPSNILDNGYAPGTVNINGDTPVVLTREGPDMGGYMCICTVATTEMWKLGQLIPGNSSVRFRRISWEESLRRIKQRGRWLSALKDFVESGNESEETFNLSMDSVHPDAFHPTTLYVLYAREENPSTPQVTFRQAGDSAILVEFGGMNLDVIIRARIHAFQKIIESRNVPGTLSLCPCIRSILCYYDPEIMSQDDFLRVLVRSERQIGANMDDMKFIGRKITFPIVLDDKWNREALQRYMSSIRDKAVYLPSNVDYLARNNGLSSAEEALQKLIESEWIVLGVGFYFACPFLIPIDPLCRLIAQKMNPSRTYTPRGAIGIAGPVAAIYPIESPGGYQLFGRTLPTWQTWGKGQDFQPDRPWLLQAFDQIIFKPVTEEQYLEFEKQFDAGQYVFEIQHSTFSVQEHTEFISSLRFRIAAFRSRQDEGRKREEQREQILLREWEEEREAKQSTAEHGMLLDDDVDVNDKVTAPIFANVWKLRCKPGDTIESDTQVLLVLEAMKTEIPVVSGEGNVGKMVKGFGINVREGVSVAKGDTLVVLSP